MDSPEGLGRARSPAAKHFLAIYTAKHSNSLIESTLMFNVDLLQSAEISHCRQNWYYGLQAMYSSTALKSGGSVHFWTPTARKWGGQDPATPQVRRHWI